MDPPEVKKYAVASDVRLVSRVKKQNCVVDGFGRDGERVGSTIAIFGGISSISIISHKLEIIWMTRAPVRPFSHHPDTQASFDLW